MEQRDAVLLNGKKSPSPPQPSRCRNVNLQTRIFAE
jgi:hypothetical protein